MGDTNSWKSVEDPTVTRGNRFSRGVTGKEF